MSNGMFCTESEVLALLHSTAASVDVKPVVFVAKRETSKDNQFSFTSTFAIQTSADNEALIIALLKLGLEEPNIKLKGSDVDLQGNNLLVDFIWVDVLIQPKLS